MANLGKCLGSEGKQNLCQHGRHTNNIGCFQHAKVFLDRVHQVGHVVLVVSGDKYNSGHSLGQSYEMVLLREKTTDTKKGFCKRRFFYKWMIVGFHVNQQKSNCRVMQAQCPGAAVSYSSWLLASSSIFF